MSPFWTGLCVGIAFSVAPAALAAALMVRRVRSLVERATKAERLAHLGTLTGGLAHEIKNPLSTIGLNIQLLQEDLNDLLSDLSNSSSNSPDSAAQPSNGITEDRMNRLQRRFSSLARENQRLRHILDDFLRFAGRLKLDRTQTDLNAVVAELADFFSPQAQAANVRLRVQLAPQPVLAWVDQEMLKQALLNLLINALHAMTDAQEKGTPHGGATDLILSTERARPGRREARIHVIDTGPGIPADQLEKVFTPYFSTKKQGTGLGLPTTRRIIEEHGGKVTIHTEPGKGTDFTLVIPIDAPAEANPSTQSEPT
jgi:signal transduction histidine kinase